MKTAHLEWQDWFREGGREDTACTLQGTEAVRAVIERR